MVLNYVLSVETLRGSIHGSKHFIALLVDICGAYKNEVLSGDDMKKTNTERASELLKELKYNLFTPEFVSDEEAEMLYHTILFWRHHSNAYFNLLENN